jgi:hypothetical protein
VAIDLWASGSRTRPLSAFRWCTQVAAVAFTPELESIGKWSFSRQVVDLAATELKTMKHAAFARSSVTRVSIPASLREMRERVFESTPLLSLD